MADAARVTAFVKAKPSVVLTFAHEQVSTEVTEPVLRNRTRNDPKEKKRVEHDIEEEEEAAEADKAALSLSRAAAELRVANEVEKASSLQNVSAPLPVKATEEEALGDLDIDLLKRLHWRMLEGYRCWLEHNDFQTAAADPNSATIIERLQHLCVNFHRTLCGAAGARPDGTKNRPFALDLVALHRGLKQINRGEINIDDMTYNALKPSADLLHPMAALKEPTTSHYALMFEKYQINFTWGGNEAPLALLFRTHIDTQARNLERQLGRYVPRVSLKQKSVIGEEDGPLKPQLTPVSAQSYPKYFHSPKGASVIFILLLNYFSLIVYKVWALVFALAIARSWTSHKFFNELARADGICMAVQALLEIGSRFLLYRSKLFRSFPWNPVLTVIIVTAQLGLASAGGFMITGLADNAFESQVNIPDSLGKIKLLFTDGVLIINLSLLYLLARIAAFAVFNVFLWLAFTPIIEGSAKTRFSLWQSIRRKMRLRTFATLLYWAIVLGICALFEVKVLLPSVSMLTPREACMCTSFSTCTYQSSLQCLLTISAVWLLVFTNFIVDTHVVFVGLLSIIGLFVGVTSRLRPQDLFQLRVEPYLIVNKLKAKYLPPSSTVRDGMRVWDGIISEMYEADLISEEHCKQLKLVNCIPDEVWSIELPVFEAQERLSFFINSLAMDSPSAPTVSHLQSVSTIVPCYDETLVFSYDELCKPHYYGGKPGPTDIENLVSVYPIEWDYFTSRMKSKGYIAYNWTPQYLLEEFVKRRLVPDSILVDKIRLWCSYRAQTVARTIRGITYYEKVLSEIGCDHKTRKSKFQVLLSLQTYTTFDANKLNGLHLLLREFPHVEIVYEWDREAAAKPYLRPHVAEKLKFLGDAGVTFAIVKEEWNIREQRLEVTEVLPRTLHLLLGPDGERLQGKALNQRNALMFAWGEVLQTLDANQDGTFEDALKVPCLLQYFYNKSSDGSPDYKALGPPRYRIIGFREAIFTSQLSTVGRYMALADFSFTTIFSRVLANPLSVRMHYGHPDFFDACWVMSRGSLCKASPKINLNEDIFAGYMATLRNQRITHKEFLQMRKGREISLKLADQFDAKLAEGAAAQMRSSDLFELNQRLNFAKKASMFYGSTGFYIIMCIMASSITLYVLAVLLFALLGDNFIELRDLGSIYSTEFIIALGFIYMLPGVVEQLIQFGPKTLASIVLHFIPSSMFFGFLLQTKAHNFFTSLVTGCATYRATGRKITIEHSSLKDLFISYHDSHFCAGVRLLFMISLYHFVARSNASSLGALPLFTPTILAFDWILCPILFNPFPSFEGTARDAKDVWNWLTRPWDLDLCALSYLHPKGDKKLGVPTRKDVDQDSWANWYVLCRCNSQRNKRGILFALVKQLFSLALFVVFVLGMTPTSLLCSIYVCLIGSLFLFVAGVRKLLRFLASSGSSSWDTASNVLSILSVAACLTMVVYLLGVRPLAVATTFQFLDFVVGVVALVLTLGLLGDAILILSAPSLASHPKRFVSMVAYLSSGTLHMKIAWLSAMLVVLLQLVFGYMLALFPKLHTTFLFNPNLTTRTHGLDKLPCGTLRKLEMGAAPKVVAP